MALETATYIDALVVTNPDGADQLSTADDHIRLLKACLQRTFPKIDGAVSASAGDINLVDGLGAAGVTTAELGYVNDVTSDIQAQLDGKASSASLALVVGVEVVLTSDVGIVATSTPAVVTGLAWTLLPASWYAIEGTMIADFGSTVTSLRWEFDNAPQGGTHMGVGSGTDASPKADGAAVTLDIGYGASSGFDTLDYRGFIQTHATLTASAHVAISGSDASTNTIKAGTHIKLRKIS